MVGEGVTTPAHEAPLVFPSVAFRPVRLLAVCAALTAVAIALSAWAGYVLFGVFFGIGLGLGLVNALLVQRSVASITADAHPLKRKMALNSATRLLVMSAVALALAIVFKSQGGIGVLFGMALFQVLLVLSTALPVFKKIRTGGDISDPPAEDATTVATSSANPVSRHDQMPKD